MKEFIKNLFSGFIWSFPAVIFLFVSIGLLLFKIHTFHPWVAIMCFIVVVLSLTFSILVLLLRQYNHIEFTLIFSNKLFLLFISTFPSGLYLFPLPDNLSNTKI